MSTDLTTLFMEEMRMNKTKEQMPDLIQRFLIDKNMSVAELATILGVGKSSVYRWMDGSRGISNRHFIQLLGLMRDYEPQWVIDMSVEELEQRFSK